MAAPERLTLSLAERYVIERELGKGGMATVYLARDLKHDRHVALKVLKPELAAMLGGERFVVEIRTTAALQHPHILPLFDSGEAGGFLYYVMPYIEGETLRDRLDRETQLAVDDAVRIASNVADALDYAHRHGVIHRDIKPENILLHDGRPMVADFGIALALSAAAGGRMTETGMSLGTPHYMSPEQATADKDISNRADIYSLAAVLYEMLSGEPPHMGNSAQAIIMKIVTEEAQPVTRLRKSVPPHVAAAVAKALEKVPADRFVSAKEFADALGNPSFATRVMVAGSPAHASPTRLARLAVPLLIALLLALGTGAWGWLRPARPAGVARYGLAFPPDQELLDGIAPTFALAPDGSWIVYDGPGPGGDQQLWLKRRDALRAVPLPGTEHRGASAPAVSPDGRWIVFSVRSELRKIPSDGGSPITVADSVSSARGVAWLDDGTIVYRDRGNRLRRVPDTGGDAAVVWSPGKGSDNRARLPTALPGSRAVLVALCPDAVCTSESVGSLDLGSGELRGLVADAVQGWYAPTGHLVVVRRDGGVSAAPFDLKRGRLTGPSVPLMSGVQIETNYPDFALSASGSMLMIAGGTSASTGALVEAMWVARDGTARPVDPGWTFASGGNAGRAISPDGRRLALTIVGPSGNDIWVKELDHGPLSRLTGDPGPEIRPRWTPDGLSVLYVSASQMLLRRRADGTQPADTLLRLSEPIFEAQWSRDGAWVVVRVGGGDGSRDIWAQRIGTDTTAKRLLASDFDENAMALSPDGRWIAYQSTETGATEVFVRPFPDIASGKWTVSLRGGSQPVWSHSGRELFYIDAQRNLVAARVRGTGPTAFEVIERKPLFSVAPFVTGSNYSGYDVAPDDARFLMIRRLGSADSTQATTLVLAENWFEELRARMRR